MLRRVTLAAIVALALGTGVRAEDDAPDPLDRVEACVREGLEKLALKEKDIRPGHDFISADGWRLPLIDEYLNRPLGVPRDVGKRFTPWTAVETTKLSDELERAYTTLGWKTKRVSLPRRKSDVAGALRDLWQGAETETKPPARKELTKTLAPIPRAVRPFLTDLLRALKKAVELRTMAFADLTEDEWVQLRKFGSQFNTGIPTHVQVQFLEGLHSRIDLGRIGQAALEVAAVLDGAGALKDKLGSSGKSFQIAWDTPLGRVEIGGFGENRYEKDGLLVLDLGGDDVHAHSAGGTLYTPCKTSVCVDLAGDDRYEYEKVGLAQGSGTYGVGVLVDADGDDIYVSKNVSQGTGHVGVGVLWDLEGKDRYEARQMAQGAALQGVGLLRDDLGDDVYDVKFMGQGLGSTLGFGILQDRAGDDHYKAGGLMADTGRDDDHFLSLAQGHGQGNRAGNLSHCSSGGIGLLADCAGDDKYQADVFGQGCAYWYAIGVLLDREGADEYEIYNYGQGGGFHMAVGIFRDDDGDDTYVGPHHSQGHALDRSVAWFLELRGNDSYTAESDSQGSGVKPYAVGFLADLQGDDVYRGGTPGYSRVPAEGPDGPWPKGFFMDLGGGKDVYETALPAYEPEMGGEVGDGKTWTVNGHGWGTDR